jgi:acyl carrier protein
MEIRFSSIRELKKFIWFDRRKETFEQCLSLLADNENIKKVVIKTTNENHVRCLEDLRDWIDVYQGDATVNGIQLFQRCMELSQKYDVEFQFEHIPHKNLSKKEWLAKMELELQQLKTEREGNQNVKENGDRCSDI